MGSGGSYYSISHSGSMSDSRTANVENQLNKIDYQIAVNKTIKDYLSESQRDTALTSDRLDTLKEILSSDMDSIKTLFGGSVKKHTYVEGLSDTDVLLVLNDTNLQDKDPNYVKDYVYDAITSKKIDDVENVKKGNLAVTIVYKDGSEIQLLPAIRKNEKFKIPGDDGKWSSLIHPEKFARSLVQVNKENNGKVIQTIRIVKGIQSKLPEKDRLSSYHIESLAVKIFEKNEKPMSNQERILYFFKCSKELVKKPIRDSTNQSAYVDEYLGDENSSRRNDVSKALDRTYYELNGAEMNNNIDKWKTILNLGEQ